MYDETRSFFATAAAYGSRPPRACRRWVCYFILVAGIACTTLSSKFAYERMAVDKQGLALHRSSWVSRNAAADGSRLRVVGRWVRVLAFGTLARRESCAMASAQEQQVC